MSYGERVEHVIEFDEDVDNDRTQWWCECGAGGNVASDRWDVAAEKHVREGETISYRYAAR